MIKANKGLFRFFLISIPFIFAHYNSFGQDNQSHSPVIIFRSYNGMMLNINQSDSSDFSEFKNSTYKEDHYELFEDGVKIESELCKQHQTIFRKTNGAYIFPLENDDTIRLKKITKEENFKGMMDYKFIGQFENYIVIYADGFEWWSYYLVDLNGKTNYYLPGEPKFNRFNNTVISWTNYYGNSDLSIIDLEYNHDCMISINTYEIDEFKSADREIVLKLSNSQEIGKKTFYYRILWNRFNIKS
jgi:hypothetical protein